MLKGKRILIGITGSIAAYKIVSLVRLLIKAEAEVKVIMTTAAKDFVSPLVLSTLSKNNVVIDIASENTWANHVMLGRWADVFLVAPLSCNSLAKMANGLCDNILLAAYLSATCPVVLAPAMDEDMWKHAATKSNLKKVESFGNIIMPVNNGELASGLIGEGRMAEPEEIFIFLVERFFRKKALQNKKVLITAGPTYEPIDPVRFIGNHSSGKMGFALAEECYLQGADVILITGPTHLQTNFNGIKRVDVKTAEEMYNACKTAFSKTNIAIMSAAVADYKPLEVAKQKIKKKDAQLNLGLTKTTDILASLGKIKKKNQYLLGFALETNNEVENALQKLKLKNADCIVLNSLNDKQVAFGFDTNKITILKKDGSLVPFELKQKQAVAKDIVQHIINDIK